MSIAHTVTHASPSGDHLYLLAEDADGNEIEMVVRDYTMPVSAGDHLSFGCAGVQYDDGSVFGGSGYVTHDGHPWPYRRISSIALVEAWRVPEAPPASFPSSRNTSSTPAPVADAA